MDHQFQVRLIADSCAGRWSKSGIRRHGLHINLRQVLVCSKAGVSNHMLRDLATLEGPKSVSHLLPLRGDLPN